MNYNNNLLNEIKTIDKKFRKLRDNKIDRNDVVLNAAAIQDQMLIDMGLKKRKKILNKIKPRKINEKCNLIPDILEKMKTSKLENEKESSILKRQKEFFKNLTFAEKVGIKGINSMPLSINEWKKVEEKTNARQDHKSDCPICLEPLSKRKSILLSCSHIFHEVCINNFEKFTSSKKCPICRCYNYESKNYYKDKEYFIVFNIILIQKYFRGYICRIKMFQNIFRINMPKNKHLRSIYSFWKIKELTTKMCVIIEKKNLETTEFINKLSKEVDQIKLINKENFNIKPDWNVVLKEVKKRKNTTCAICLTNLNKSKIYILNCTHCYHKNCLDSFEKFDIYYERRCPICRCNYEKQEGYLNV